METGDWGKKDRLSHRTSIGVVGNGFVGGAVVKGFGDYCIVNVFDSDPDRCYNTYNETIFSDIVFVCLPTPMLDVEGGDCNLSILENFFLLGGQTLPRRTSDDSKLARTIRFGSVLILPTIFFRKSHVRRSGHSRHPRRSHPLRLFT